MGMSASQARLLSLQARQSNLEYEGQQINQERTILSQQCTALYNSLLSMTVPTPPSTSDYTTIEYSGLDGASKFKLGTITPKEGGSYSVETKYTKTGNCIQGGEFPRISVYDVDETIKVDDADALGYNAPQKVTQYQYSNLDNNSGAELGNKSIYDITHVPAEVDEETGEQTAPAYDKYSLKSNAGEQSIFHGIANESDGAKYTGSNYEFYYKNNKGVMIKCDSFDEAWKTVTDGETQNADGKYEEKNGIENIVYVKTTVADVIDKEGTSQDGVDNKYYNFDGENSYDYLIQDSNQKEFIEGGLTEDQVRGQTFINSQTGEIVTLQKLGVDVNGVARYELPVNVVRQNSNSGAKEIKNPKYDEAQAKLNCTLDGHPVQALSAELLGSTYQSAIEAIANTYPEYKDGTSINEAAICNDFMVMFKKNASGVEVPYFVKTAEWNVAQERGTGTVETFSLEPNGQYTASETKDDCKLTFDSSGRITAIDLPVYDSNGVLKGYNKIELTATKVTDDAAYKQAFNDYEYEKYKYDKKQQEINAQTEIIQQEDRNLELKLQRLDNERTQITTEIEAVTKVIKDNIEKSYKTFSG